MRTPSLVRRWVTFNAVGALGVPLQLGLIAVLVHAMGVHYLTATVIAVEAAILHNFVWHLRWTWKDRPASRPAVLARRLVAFHLLNGGVSVVGNLAIMAALTGAGGVEPIAANLLAITACSLVNFTVSDTVVFKSAGVAAAVLIASMPATAWAGPSPAAASAWTRYDSGVNGRLAASTATGSFFALDSRAAAGWRDRIRNGGVEMVEIDTPGISGAHIHHWVGATFIRGATLDEVMKRLEQQAGNESRYYEDVVSSRLLSHDGDRYNIYMKLRRTTLITVTYNTEHAVEYRRLGGGRATSRSVATKIAELDDAGTAREREKRDGDDNGFLWRLNAYWRYEQTPDGVIVECESVSLSRHVPVLLRPVASPIVNRIARESLDKTLRGLRSYLGRK
jgi:putative flippase GtrA